MFEQLNFRVNFNDADYSILSIPPGDRMVLRELAKRVAEAAHRPIMDEKRSLWKRHNALERTPPVVLCDPENGWNEIITGKDLACVNNVARYWENHLRKQLFWADRMGDDYVVEPIFNTPYIYDDSQWSIRGVTKDYTKRKTAEDGKAYHIEKILDDFTQLDQLAEPRLVVDYETSFRALEQAHHIFDGILTVRLNSIWFWSFGLTDDYVFLRGMEQMMFDLVDEPENVHRLMEILYKGMMSRLDFLESHNLLCLNNDGTYVGSGGMGYIDNVLPAGDFRGTVRTKDMWGLAESQVTVGVSPDMFEEFVFPYQRRLMERFALTCYGCCEPMDDRFDIVRQAKNLRRVSVSPWADKRLMAEKLGRGYIYSMKPSPSPLALPVLDEELARKDIREYLSIGKDNCLELIMKDNHTLGNNPENIVGWTRIVREEIDRM